MELENHHWVTTVIIISTNKRQWMLKLVAKSLNEKQKYLHSLKVSFHEITNNFIRENSNCSGESWQPPPEPSDRLDLPGMKQPKATCLLRGWTKKNQHHFCGIPAAKMHNQNLIMKSPDKSKQREIQQDKWPVFFKSVKVMG